MHSTIGRLTAIGALAAAVLAVTPATAQQFTMKLSTPTNNDVTVEWMNAFKAGVEARAGGRIKVEIYPASQLGPIPRTVEGVAHRELPVLSVQYHPEAAPGPHDSRYLFDRFIELMEQRKGSRR